MNNRPECLPCCLRRVHHTVSLVTGDEWLHRKILAEGMLELARADELATPAELVFACFRRAARTLGVPDPYAEDKRRWIEEATGNEDLVRAAVDRAPDPFLAALNLSVVANILDWELRHEDLAVSARASSGGYALKTLLDEAREAKLATDAVDELRGAVARAQRVLFLHASAGELFFDRLLIEKLGKPRDAVVSVVRESAVLAHATRDDADAVGIPEVARVIDPGIACSGIPLSACSTFFRDEYAAAGLVIAKGQAHYETLEGQASELAGARKEIFFLLRVKCQVIARHLGVALGACVLEPN